MTLPVIRALETSDDADELHALVTNRQMTAEELARSLSIVRASGCLEFARQKVREFLQQAKECLPAELPKDIRKTYEKAADYIAKRES